MYNFTDSFLIKYRPRPSGRGLARGLCAGSVETAARRELEEELGITDTRFLHLADLPPTPGNGMEHVALYAALYNGKVHFPAAEISGVIPFPAALIDTWLERRPQDFACSFAECWKIARTMLGEEN